MAITLNEIKKELVNLMRSNDILSIGTRGVTTKQDTGTFTAAATHTLATTPTIVKNIRGIDVDGTDLKWGEDYTINLETGVITFTLAQTGDYVIDYDVGSTDRIFPDFPQANLTLDKFPRIAVDIKGSVASEFGIGAAHTSSTYQIAIICYSKSQEEVETMISSIKTLLMANKKNLHYSAFITPTNVGSLLVSEFGEKKVFSRNQDAEVRFSIDG